MVRLFRVDEQSELNLHSRAYRQIPNAPTLEPEPDRLELNARFHQDRHANAEIRRIAGFYNCFGLAFGNRRTAIGDMSGELAQIYREDQYRRIRFDELMPGDLVMYVEDGNIEHVAVVLELGLWDAANEHRPVKVVSKWGSQNPEFLHEMRDFELGDPVEFWTDRK
jgi:hypothetical protein